MKLAWEEITVHTRRPFVIARGGSIDHHVLRIRVTDADGLEGWGEAAPNRFYGETLQSAVSALERFAPIVDAHDPFATELAEWEMNRALRFNGSVKSAVSAAMHDLAGKRLGAPLYRLWGLTPERAPHSSFTLGITKSDDELRQSIADAAPYPILKVKLGTTRDREVIRLIRELAPEKTLRVDANAAWLPKEAVEMTAMLAEHGVELVEQPVAAEDVDGLRFVRERSSLPIIADESCLTSADIPRLDGAVDGINIKLSKCGGLREAHRMIATARAHSMRVMMGCMIETSLGITAAAQMASLLDYADLDGAALLADDPHVGASIDGGVIRLPTGAGLGVTLRSAG